MAPVGVPDRLRAVAREHSEEVPRSQCSKVWFILQVLVAVFASRVAHPKKRDLHVVEFSSGHGAFSYTVRQHGMESHEFDRFTRDETESLSSLEGAIFALHLVLRLVPHGTMFASPQCSTWLRFLAASHTKRNEAVMGDISRDDVADANASATVLSYLAFVAFLRGAYFIIEQPKATHMWDFPSFASFRAMVDCKIYSTWLESFGHSMPKPSELLSNMPEDVIAPAVKDRLPKHKRSQNSATYYVRDSRGVTGTKALKGSEHYPMGFAKALAKAVANGLGKEFKRAGRV